MNNLLSFTAATASQRNFGRASDIGHPYFLGQQTLTPEPDRQDGLVRRSDMPAPKVGHAAGGGTAGLHNVRALKGRRGWWLTAVLIPGCLRNDNSGVEGTVPIAARPRGDFHGARWSVQERDHAIS